jgi:uncharacterized protein (TIGR03067 family)
MSRWVAILAVAAVPGLTAAPRAKEPPKPESPLVGVWQCETFRYSGEPVRETGFTFEFTADGKLRCVRAGRPPSPESPYKVDRTTTPARIDWTTETGDLAGILRVDKDTLTLCYVGQARPRPTEFVSPAGKPVALVTFKRVPNKN